MLGYMLKCDDHCYQCSFGMIIKRFSAAFKPLATGLLVYNYLGLPGTN